MCIHIPYVWIHTYVRTLNMCGSMHMYVHMYVHIRMYVLCVYIRKYVVYALHVYLLCTYVHVIAGECIAGWDVAVSTMRKGELSRFLISPAYAYGELGCPPRIPPNSTSE